MLCQLRVIFASPFLFFSFLFLGGDNSETDYILFLGGDNSETDYTDIRFNSNPWWLPYLFICMAVVIPILILMLIFILCIKGCKSKSFCHFHNFEIFKFLHDPHFVPLLITVSFEKKENRESACSGTFLQITDSCYEHTYR